ncbi:MAG: RsmB/NOP family class I SAM-dependent RNA methyltransferase [Fimbriimonadaceae bacterium]|nr:RsmB/NOP family class I SAM-dependent RNA methyltransferase [Fimbriimonadaceae bacterium]
MREKKRVVTYLMQRQAEVLFGDPTERAAFLEALTEGRSREKSIIVLQDRPEIRTFPRLGATAWQPDWVVRLGDGFRPAQHPLYERGAYYSLDFSSVFAASAMLAIPDAPRRVLDLCASPGGKAIFAWRAFRPELLYCNETIRKRSRTLIENLARCGAEAGRVWSADPSVYARRFSAGFDLVIVDAPCSGQSLLAKGDVAPGAFDPPMVDMNHSRQRRITGNAVHCLAPGGYLLYMTCTFSRKENERIVQWLLEEHSELEAVEVPHLAAHRSPYADVPCYRLFPHSGLGAGAFTALLRRKGDRAELPEFDEMPTIWSYGQPIPFASREDEAGDAAPAETESKPKSESKPRRAYGKPAPKVARRPGYGRRESGGRSNRPGRRGKR